MSLTRTPNNPAQADWVTWIKRVGSEPASQVVSRHDEEIGTPTGVEEISEVGVTEDTSAGSKVWEGWDHKSRI